MNADNLWLMAALGGTTFVGASTQRISGVGFALVTSPFLIIFLGPLNGVLLVNALGMFTTLLAFTQVIKEVEYRRVFLMMGPAIVAMLPGAWVATHTSPALLSVIIGTMIIVALLASVTSRRTAFFQGRSGAGIAGFISGFMNVTAGVGGPAVTAYALATRWRHAAFAASAQLYFFGIDAASLMAYGALPSLDGPGWAACGIALIAGIMVGNVLAAKIRPRVSMATVVILAFAGAVLIIIKGSVALLT